jgi:putative membrane protein
MRLLLNWLLSAISLLIKIITLPLTFLTLGIFWWVINALMLMFASMLLSPDFIVRGFWPAFWGAIVLSLINMVLKAVARDVEKA